MFKETKEVIMLKGPNGHIWVSTVFPEAPKANIFASYLHFKCWLLFYSKSIENSVLTRILPWGVPGPPLLRNRGPART